MEQLRRRGVNLDVVCDIGAHRGEWTRRIEQTLSDAQFFLFEANATHAAALAATGHRYCISVLSSEEKLVEFYSTGGSGDSYLRERSKHYVEVEPESVRTTTLADVIRAHDFPSPDFIKADVQGSELDVLRGAGDALTTSKLVLLECPLMEYNEGAPHATEYLAFMADRGFSPIDFVDATWLKQRMIQVDILFANAETATAFV